MKDIISSPSCKYTLSTILTLSGIMLQFTFPSIVLAQEDITIDSTDGPLKIQFELEQDPDALNFYDVQDYTFESRGLQPESYKLQGNEPFGGRILADRGTVSLLGLDNLEVKNGTDIDVMQVSGFMSVDKIQEDATRTTYSLDRDELITIGDLKWYDVTGNLTTTADGSEGTLMLVDRP
jgi:hypothetical protein